MDVCTIDRDTALIIKWIIFQALYYFFFWFVDKDNCIYDMY